MKFFIFPIFLLFFFGCSPKNYTSKESYIITIKSKDFKFSDMGIISKSEDSILVDIFAVGHQVLKLEMGTFISVNGGVPTPYKIFNMKFLQSEYPSKIIKNIFSGKPIFSSQNLDKNFNGFSQKIDEIIYKVSKTNIYFKDSKSKILIKIRKIQ